MSQLEKADIIKLLENRLRTSDFDLISCEESSTKDVSTGFLSFANKMTIVYARGGIKHEFNVFIKEVPRGRAHCEDVLSLGGCHKEPLIYNKFLNNLEVKRNEKFFPECYLARSNEIVVLEDLSSLGYKNLPLLRDYDLEHCEKTITSIAKLHAASIIFERKHNIKLNDYITELNEENIFRTEEDHVGRKRYDVGTKALKQVAANYFTKFSKDCVSKAFGFMDRLPEKLLSSEIFPNVLTHTDLWNNNIMFKYNKNGEVQKSCLIDFQICTYRPPSFDLQLFIHCCTDREFRRKHYKELLEFYYSQLKAELSEENIDIDFMPWEMFMSMAEETLPLALVLAPQFMHFVAIPEKVLKSIFTEGRKWNEFYQVDRNDIVLQAIKDDERYKVKLIEGLTDLFEYFES